MHKLTSIHSAGGCARYSCLMVCAGGRSCHMLNFWGTYPFADRPVLRCCGGPAYVPVAADGSNPGCRTASAAGAFANIAAATCLDGPLLPGIDPGCSATGTAAAAVQAPLSAFAFSAAICFRSFFLDLPLFSLNLGASSGHMWQNLHNCPLEQPCFR